MPYCIGLHLFYYKIEMPIMSGYDWFIEYYELSQKKKMGLTPIIMPILWPISDTYFIYFNVFKCENISTWIKVSNENWCNQDQLQNLCILNVSFE